MNIDNSSSHIHTNTLSLVKMEVKHGSIQKKSEHCHILSQGLLFASIKLLSLTEKNGLPDKRTLLKFVELNTHDDHSCQHWLCVTDATEFPVVKLHHMQTVCKLTGYLQ